MMGSASGTDRDGGQSRAEGHGAALARSADASEGLWLGSIQHTELLAEVCVL